MTDRGPVAALERGELSAARRALLEQRLRRRPAAPVATIPRRPAGDAEPPLSFAQERLWFMEQFAPGTAAYHIPLGLRLRGALDAGALARALNEVAARHEGLRACFAANGDGRPVLRLDPRAEVELRAVTPLGRDAAERERHAAGLVGQEAARPFDLGRSPLLRALVARLAEDDHVLVVTVHHIVSDGWSADVLLGELTALYDAFRAGAPSPLPALPLQYGDYALWQRERLRGPLLERDLAYWRAQLAGLPPLELPTDRPRPPEMRFDGAGYRFRLDRELTGAVVGLARAHGATTYMALLAGFQAVLSRWSGQRDLAVGSPVAGRPRRELEGLVGLFVNMLTLRADLSGDPSFGELLGRTRETALDAYAHQEVPFEQLVSELHVRRDVSRSALFQAVFALQNYGGGRPLAARELSVGWYPLETAVTRFDLELFCWETGDALEGIFTYRTDLFERGTIARMAGHLETLLRSAAARPDARLSELDLLGPAERELVLERWNRAEPVPPGPPGLHEVIAGPAASSPDAPAVVLGERSLTYAELDRRSNRLARHLRRLGVRPEARVGICLEQSLELPVAVLGVLKAGAAYLPLDPEQPAERLSRLLADAGAGVVLTMSGAPHPSGPGAPRIVRLDADRSAIGAEPAGAVASGVRPDNLAYVIYTSGSTGRPKGVAVQHRQVVNYLAGVRRRFGIAPGAAFGLPQSMVFDFAITTFFLALMTGGCLHLLPRRLTGAELAEHLDRFPVDYLKLTPSHMAALAADADPRRLLPGRLLVLGGEASGWAWARDLAALDACRIANHYGPTETTVGVATFDVLPDAGAGGGTGAPTTPIGRPLPHARVYVLDGRLEPVPPGVVGEICAGGDRLARGYLGQPALTAERFVPDPHGAPGTRLYRTGDLGRWLASGDLEFLGRRDQQVKVRGYRVELGEIEAALSRCPSVAQAVVEARGAQGAQRLVAYLVGVDGRPRPGAGELRRLLGSELPEYLVPARYVWLDRLPLKAHGKVDRASLPEPDAGRPEEEATYAAPSGPVEEAVAEVWSGVLGVRRVGALDDFFELGGHSLLAMQVIARLRRAIPATGRPISVMDLFKHPTVRGLAELIQLPEERRGPRRLLHELSAPVAPGRRVLSLVCVPYGGGSAVVYQPLADQLPAGCSLYALAIPGHDPGLTEVPQPLEEVARRCVAEILERVDGPLVLYGHCGVGGALAADLARRLEAAGRPLDAVYLGGIFPFARPRGRLMARLTRVAGLEWLRGDRVHANWLQSMGADVADLDPEARRQTIRNLRRDTRAAEEYFTERMEERLAPLAAPAISVVGERDPGTEFYRERYREWHFLAASTALVVLDEAGHYFLKYRAAELAEIVTRTHPALAAGARDTLTAEARGPEASWWLRDVSDAAAGATAGAERDAGTRARRRAAPQPSLGRFLAVALSQLVSISGSAVTEFAIPLWIYLATGSLVQFALFAVLGLVPGILVAPLAGAVVDRSNRRGVMLAGDCAAGLTLTAMALLLLSGRLQLWHIYALIVCLSVSLTFQRLAYASAIPQLVPKRYLGHANGIVQMAGGMAQFVVPLAAVALVATLGLRGILALDVLTYVVSVTVVLLVRFPAAMAQTRRESLMAEILGGVRYSVGRRGFRAMLGYFALLNVFLAPLLMLISPLVLSFGTLAAVGQVSVAGAAGATLGGLTMAVWGGPGQRRMRGVLAATCALAAFAVVTGLRASALVVGLGVFGMIFWLAIVNGVYATIIQVKVPQRFQGRVIALNTIVAWSTLPIGFGLVGPLGARLFEPLLAPHGPLAASVGAVIGVGAGRGIGLMYVVFGLAMAAVAVGALRHRTLSRFDDEVPDAVPDDVAGIEARRQRGHRSDNGGR
jgi:amino acid adenylation domain-containing protein